MLSEKKNSVNLQNIENEQINNSMREIDNQHQNNNIPRGFNIFLAHGISPNELRTLRIIYHLSYIHNSIANNRNIDLSPQAMFQREENWLRAQMNNMRNNYNNYNYRRNIIIPNPRNNSVMVYINHNMNNNRFRQRRYYYREVNYEPNINFLQGFIFGMVLNIFSLCILMISRPRPKFKFGLLLGMIFSFCITFPFMLEQK